MRQPEAVTHFLEREYLGNTMAQWVLAAGIFVGLFLALSMLRALVQKRAARLDKVEGKPLLAFVLRLIARVSITLIIVLAAVAGSRALIMNPGLKRGLDLVVVVGLAWQALAWGHVVLDTLIDGFLRRRPGPDGKPDPALIAPMGLVRIIALVGLYASVLLLAAQNLGIEVTPLIAGLGVTGLAVALAVQNILGDLFSSLSIVLDKPFVVGDYIVVSPTHQGTVEKIGLKTTRVRSITGEQLVFANSDLLASRIQNFKRMKDRRVVFTFGLVYQTEPERVERAQQIIREAIERQPRARFERAHLKAFGAAALEFEAVYIVHSPEAEVYMDTQQAINLEILRRFGEEGIEFAFPPYLPRPEPARPRG